MVIKRLRVNTKHSGLYYPLQLKKIQPLKSEKKEYLLKMTDISPEPQLEILAEHNRIITGTIQDFAEADMILREGGLLENLLFQFVLHNSSVEKLSQPLSIHLRDDKLKRIDLSALYSMGRLQIETYTNLAHLFFSKSSIPEENRQLNYKIHGLRKQLSLTNQPISNPAVAKIKSELDEEIEKLKKTKYFNSLPTPEREKLLYPKHARLSKPEHIREEMGLGNVELGHSLYSNHLHSEYVGMRQFILVKHGGMPDREMGIVLYLCNQLSASIIIELLKRFESNSRTLTYLEEIQRTRLSLFLDVAKRVSGMRL